MDYFSWIANLGVVPLLRLAALRLAPILRCLAFLLFSVTPVLDAINRSYLASLGNKFVRPLVLALILCHVKEIIGAYPDSCFASEAHENETIVIARGEQRELRFPSMKRFSLGNREILSYKAIGRDRLLIKGKSVGYSDLIIWDHNGRRTSHIYVLSKDQFAKTTRLAEALKGMNLTLDLKGPVISVAGTVTTLSDYLYLLKIQETQKERIYFRTTLSKELRNFIAAAVYQKLYAMEYDRISCEAFHLQMTCSWEGQRANSSDELKQISEQYGVKFVRRASRWHQRNFRIKLKLIQVERTDGQEVNLGLALLQGNPHELFMGGLRQMLERNQLLLQENHLDISTLAEPESIIHLDRPHVVEIGAQLPFQNISTQGAAVIAPLDWKFAGLKIEAKLQEDYGQLFLEYKTEFTRPEDSGISGSKEQSTLMVAPNKPVKLFSVGYRVQAQDKRHLPGLKSIPILRDLFGSSSKSETFKRLEGYLLLEEI